MINEFNEDFDCDLDEGFAPLVVTPPTQKKIENIFMGIGVPDCINLEDFDIEKAPGLVGEIASYMRDGAARPVSGGAYPLMAMQCIAGAAGSMRGFGGVKLSLITITLGVSAAGKERPQSVAKSLFDLSGVPVAGKMRSDKDVIRSLVRNGGRCVYILDEAQSILVDSLNGSNKTTAGVPDLLMELTTTDRFKLPEIHRDEFASKTQASINKLKKELSAKDDIKAGYNVDFQQDLIKKIDLEIASIKDKIKPLEETIKMIEVGIKNPSVNLAAFSTPIKLASIITEDTVESGFLGRALIADCGSEAERLNEALLDELDLGYGETLSRLKAQKTMIEQEIGFIYQMSQENSQINVDNEFNESGVISASEQAISMMREVRRFYDHNDEYLNHPRLGALFRRIPERIRSLCSILALGEIYKKGKAEITTEHVSYSLALILSSISMLGGNLAINEASTSERAEEQLKGLRGLIVKALTVSKGDKHQGWRYRSKIDDSIKRRKFYAGIEKEHLKNGQCPISNSIYTLIGQGVIVMSECQKKIKLA